MPLPTFFEDLFIQSVLSSLFFKQYKLKKKKEKRKEISNMISFDSH